ncbi:MAG: 2-oxo acid dehydrogenase subunit E2, partial [Desulfobacterales bacterium]
GKMNASINIKMPKWDPEMKEGKISRWFIKEGETIDKGEDLFEVKTEKITQKVPSPGKGRLSQIFIPAGISVPVKVVVAILAELEV